MIDQPQYIIPKIIILDSHPVPRMGLSFLLKEKFKPENVSDFESFNGFQESQQAQGALLFILVINTDFEEDGLNPVSTIKSVYPDAQVVLYGEEMRPEIVIDYLKTGANGYLLKHKDLTELINCIHTVAQGKRYVSAGHLEHLFEYLLKNYKTSRKYDLLTPRQKEVAKLLVQGMTTSLIAEKTGLHISTISTFKTAIFAKLGIDNILKLKEILDEG
ncbi:LuxR C-terminal-related transcriptional regulator [Dyadobacter bucti]|jgi:DNA-binding NarL/FixJ family response regulator|uniref:LuxR C-terminal-related transcriptional regulator n=1 Tax=Dyadobacter bucti TaxID=2572203 RepID=UPI001109DE8F|nr:response regulator transcription factor [Dyadobacter bucti]